MICSVDGCMSGEHCVIRSKPRRVLEIVIQHTRPRSIRRSGWVENISYANWPPKASCLPTVSLRILLLSIISQQHNSNGYHGNRKKNAKTIDTDAVNWQV